MIGHGREPHGLVTLLKCPFWSKGSMIGVAKVCDAFGKALAAQPAWRRIFPKRRRASAPACRQGLQITTLYPQEYSVDAGDSASLYS